jgi:hypothetical protein
MVIANLRENDREDYLEMLRQELECERYEREHAGDTAFGLFSLGAHGLAAQQPVRDWDLELAPS